MKNINTGWADSVAKVLQMKKSKKKKALVLSKAKTLTDVKESALENNTSNTTQNKEKCKKRDLPTIRVKSVTIFQRTKERNLQKIATKGIVQLFNVVNTQQKQINEKFENAGPLEVKRQKVMKDVNKNDFLDVLMGSSCSRPDDNPEEQIETSEWAPLQNNFLTRAKLKDWDQNVNYEKELEAV